MSSCGSNIVHCYAPALYGSVIDPVHYANRLGQTAPSPQTPAPATAAPSTGPSTATIVIGALAVAAVAAAGYWAYRQRFHPAAKPAESTRRRSR
jgi:hypothetical protein